ncbi:Protein DML1 [Tolypocladium ophioglossoides CBS 100239]|uniref:Protein DML1 n=1 Tax=Tolypocladium ophioglossoides (strain CBS 100239) TaxID=1163406 RepID=A0A0L0NF02_TOLOC|nr:Protein DML1 [Tolypocladium ophioglossoides CBS 100239]
MREIITLQLGNLSNYTATHFWNTQESYFTYGNQEKSPIDHNVHWRGGVGQDGSETFLPRTVIYDLKGGFGSLRKINTLYDTTSESNAAADSLWPGPSAVHKQAAVHPSVYQQSLDAGTEPPRLAKSTVRYWSDFSRVYFHPKSLVQLYDYELDSSIRPFERFAMGMELFDSLDKEHDIVDRDWRPFVEECDLMQGIQVFTTLDDSWGGFASSYLEALRDEYPKSCIWVWGIQSPLVDVSRETRQLRLVNTAQSLSQACSQASMVVPLALPEGRLPSKLAVDRSSLWHVSGLFSTAVESATLQSRLAAESGYQPISLSAMAESLNTDGKQTLASAKMDVGPHADEADRETLDVDFFHLGRDSNVRGKDRAGRVFGQLSSYRGPQDTSDGNGPNPKSWPIVGNPVIRQYTSRLQFPLLDSYPHIYIDASADQAGIPVRTVLSTNTAMSACVKTLQFQVSRSIAAEEREMLSNGLAEIADAYQNNWSSGSDADDDDM